MSFDQTHWTLISRLRSAEQTDADTRTALDELCRSYWSPIYSYLRRFGKSPEDAACLSQVVRPR